MEAVGGEGVAAAGWLEPALAAHDRRECDLVEADEEDEGERGEAPPLADCCVLLVGISHGRTRVSGRSVFATGDRTRRRVRGESADSRPSGGVRAF